MLRICDNRLDPTFLTEIERFRNVCGIKDPNKVVFVTTMWEGEDLGQLAAIEDALTREDLSGMIKEGSRVMRFMNTPQSAWEIINLFINVDHAEQATRNKSDNYGDFANTTKTMTTNTSVGLNLLRIHRFFARDRKKNRLFTQLDCRSVLLDVAKSDARRKMLCSLRGDDAQVMVDYLSLVCVVRVLRRLYIQRNHRNCVKRMS